MKKLVRLMAVGLTKEFIIEFLNLRIVMRLTVRLPLIFQIKGSGSLLLVGIHDIVIFVRQEELTHIRLASDVYTSAGASHDLYEMIF